MPNLFKIFHQLGEKRCSWKKLSFSLPFADLQPLAVTCIVVTGTLLGVRHLGWLQPLELKAFDLMVQLRPDAGPDPRLLVVTVTEQDIHTFKKWPISDGVLARAIASIARLEPVAIGLDIIRDIPYEPGNAELAAQFTNPKLIPITFIGKSEYDRALPPPNIPKARIGFNDLVIDPDGIIRRSLIFRSNGQSTLSSFALRLAFKYIDSKKIPSTLTKDQEIKAGNTVFSRLRSDSGGYQTIDTGGYQILLNYRSPENTAKTVTLTQVLEGKLDPELVKDKIVIIGVTAPTTKDVFSTPYSATASDNRMMPGVFIHAAATSQIINAALDGKNLFWFWDEWQEMLWIAVWGAVGGCLAWRLENTINFIVSAIALGCILWGFTFFLFTQQGWISLASPTLAFLIAPAVIITYKYQQSKQQQEIVMKLLGQQTSPAIANALWKERVHLLQSGLLPGQRLTATMILTDLQGFSTISEKLSPEVVMPWLNEYLSAMAEEVQKHHGVINKFTGDGMLAVFGVPIPRTTPEEIAEDARLAVSCALAISACLPALNQSWIDRGLPSAKMRVGIFTGPIMVGSLGGKTRLEYGVIGDSVNIASRLESCEKDRQEDTCRILIAEETLVHIQGKFEVESWGALPLKGREQKVNVYRVLGGERSSK
ncbi:MAG: adenylate/guanylate cyclase domain-containing protein [Microcoleus sp. PH2017_25_DOB_D_A]|uniref:CHASE2 domain-containing protein n=1 Tax=unclassified Microcoleus TaxID=2642155 RepID=UPI001DF77610|nr:MULTISPECIES: adenylate/guanylate cyclase domain-containing protein [unclassified Microcoleus]TAE43149.1 MAG: adenylate/guanylate cyclase domain-containing protein [Oscillatoriales cyanobacterium]MCC3472277.1 adenylate/guanylate cyclase domain-containing protein [Microcoleus sp. PH2017_13_LAR_U_A]MCC3483946.1 adenylate/guanylate cyclase domain-containing protein [Microcoleus sp. PH2017_14_LAR_D_A]MCC3490155.1 adenylate/guanylate cyclase domain-containing protein [Microcoleus sp. PH2017_16_JO